MFACRPWIASLLLSFGSGLVMAADSAEPTSLIRLRPGVGLASQAYFATTAVELNLDIASVDPERGVEVLATAEELAALDHRGIPYEMQVRDLESFYAGRLDPLAGTSESLGTWLNPMFGQGALGGYFTYDEVASVLQQMHTAYPSITTAPFSLGQTIEGRDIWAMKISDNPDIDESEPENRLDAMHHAREPESMQSVLWYMLFLLENYGTDSLANYLVNERETWFVPIVNPDGYVHNQTTNPGGGGLWRKNRRDNADSTFGVDLNRNYSYEWGYDNIGSSPNTSSETYRGTSAFSEPETTAMKNFIDSRQFETALSCHTYSNLWLYPWGYDSIFTANADEYEEVSALATEVNGYLVGPAAIVLYAANGVTTDYDHGDRGTMCWTPEIGGTNDGFWPPSTRIVPLAEENLLAFQRTTLAAGAFANASQVEILDLGDGDGAFEPGENVGFLVTVRNSGRADTSGGITLTLESSDPHLTLLNSSASLPVIASFDEADNSATLLTAQVSNLTPLASTIVADVVVEFEGLPQRTEASFVSGASFPVILDDLEVDRGWIAGIPSDTATAGLWERGDPIGTSSGSDPMNPEDDTTDGGQFCFVTGNGGGSAGSDDVDGGVTTLISPPFDLSGPSVSFVSFSRWYALASNLDDEFEISISNDDGTSWVELESVDRHVNRWTRVSFRVEDFVAPTDQMRLRFVASDDPNNSLVEAAIDDFEVTGFDELTQLNLYGEPLTGDPMLLNIGGDAGSFFLVYVGLDTLDLAFSGWGGSLQIDPSSWTRLLSGSIPAEGLYQLPFLMPDVPVLSGETLQFQALVFGDDRHFSNRDGLEFP